MSEADGQQNGQQNGQQGDQQNGQHAGRAPVRTAYLATHYPALSHSFILREIEALRRQGVEVSTFTVRRSPRADMKTEAMRREDDATRQLLGGGRTLGAMARAAARTARRDPKAFAGTLGRALRSGFPSPKERLWQLFYLGEAVLLRDQLEREGIHHIHSHHANGAADVARLAADLGNRMDKDGSWTWSFSMHGPTELENLATTDLVAKARDAAGVAAIAEFTRSQVIRHLPTSEWDKVSINHMSVDPEVFTPPASREHDGPLRLLNVGRLATQKGMPNLVRAAEELHRRGVDFELRIVGQGELREELQAQIDAAGLGAKVRLLGAMGEDEVVRQMQWCDVYVSASFAEGLPVVIMEALSTEAAVVSTAIAAIPELVRHEETGLLVPAGSVTALADAVQRLDGDPQLRRTLGRAGRRAVLEGFTIDTVGPVMAQFLRRAVTGEH